MTPEEIKAGHTYELTSGTHWTVKSFTAYGRSIIITDGEVTTFDTPRNFARYAVRDVTPAPESDQGEKVAQAQSQGASCGCGAAELTAGDWLQIEMAAKGCVSGTSDEWPGLAAAIAKLRGKPFVRRVSSAWLEGFCVGVMSMRRTPPAADAVNAELLEQLEESTTDLVVTIGNIGAEMRRSTDPNAASRWEGVIDHLQKQVAANRAAIARAEAGAHSHPRFRHRRTGDTYELLLIANEHAERTAQYPPTAVYRRVSDRTVWSRPVQDWGKDFEEVSGG